MESASTASSTPKKATKAKVQTPEKTNGEVEAESTNAEDEQTPAVEPAKKRVRKAKVATETEANEGDDLVNAGETRTSTPKKRVRKPKDPNAPPAKRAKKATKAELRAGSNGAGSELLNENEAAPSVFGGGNVGIKTEEDVPFDEEEKVIVNEGLVPDVAYA